MEQRRVFIAGGTGYMGQRLIPRLLQRGHEVRALVRPGSEKKLVTGCTPVLGNALDGRSYAGKIPPCDTFIQLVGVAHPSRRKGMSSAALISLQDLGPWPRPGRRG